MKKEIKKELKRIMKAAYRHQYSITAIAAMLVVAVGLITMITIAPGNAANNEAMMACSHEFEYDCEYPSCEEAGHYHVECTKCGYIYMDSEFKPTGHEYELRSNRWTGEDEPYCIKCGDVPEH